MESQRFDRFSKSVASNLTRREAVGGIGIAGVVAAAFPWLGLHRRSLAAVAAKTCTYSFEAAVSVGPSSESDRFKSISGELELTIGDGGAIDAGRLVAADGTESNVVGQATGRAINLRIELDDDQALVLVGTAEREVRKCRGLMSGIANGPQRGDLGDWVAEIKKDSAGSSAVTASTAAATSASSLAAEGTPAATTACDLTCWEDTGGLDESTCSCICPGMTSCVAEIGTMFAKGGVIFFEKPLTVRTGYCADTMTDQANCGACRNFCGYSEGVATAGCENGVCVYTCDANHAQCTGDAADPCTSDLRYDDEHCGACGYACTGGYQCNDGNCQCLLACLDPQTLDPSTCECVCPGGLTACGGGCVDINTDLSNCGACGHACEAIVSQCVAGKCQQPVNGG